MYRMFGALLASLLLIAACGGDDADETVEEPTATTAAAAPTATSAPVTPPPTAPPEPTPTPEPAYDFSAVSPIVETFIADNELNGAGLIVVHRDDGVVFHEHWGEFDEDRLDDCENLGLTMAAGLEAGIF